MTRSIEELFATNGLTTAPAPVAPELVLAALREVYGIDGTLEPIATEKDNTFRLRGPSGQHLVKVSQPEEPLPTLLGQIEAIRWIEQADPGIPVQSVLPARDGAAHHPLVDRAGEFQGILRVLDFIPGSLLASAEPASDQLRRVGSMLGRVDLALRDFTAEGLERPLVWDLSHFAVFAELLEHEDDAHRRAMAEEVFALFRDHVEPALPRLRRQAIHGDFSAFNIVVDPTAADYVTGVIDFGDVNLGPVIFDPAVLLANHIGETPGHPWEAAKELLAGYLSTHPLSEEEIRLLATATLARLTLRPVVTNLRLLHVPERADYLREHSRHDWARIENALAFGHDRARDYLLLAQPQRA